MYKKREPNSKESKKIKIQMENPDSSEFILETGFMAQFLLDEVFSRKQRSINNEREAEPMDHHDLVRKEFQTFKNGVSKEALILIFNQPEEFRKLPPSKRTFLLQSLLGEAEHFFSYYSSSIEIMREGHLDKVYFIKPPYSDDL